jgi:RHS repeat-associated protein
MSFNMPNVITGKDRNGNPYTYTYIYGAERERAKLLTTRTNGNYTSIYLHPAGKGQLLYEQETDPNSVVETKHYVQAGAALVGVYVTKTGQSPEMRYYHTDNIGSIVTITNESGVALTPRMAYEAFGQRRFPSGQPDPNETIVGLQTDRGFTAHEHLDELTLIHMNGRIYDPALGRFMTADPYVQSPGNLQSYNRYSYVNNNPLGYSDPSGYGRLRIGPVKISWSSNDIKTIAAVGAAIFVPQFASSFFVSSATSGFLAGGGLSTAFVTLGGEAATLTGLGWFASGAAGGLAAGFIASGGDLNATLRSGLTGGLSGALAGYFGDGYSLSRVGAESLLSGFSARLQGRPFMDGFRLGLTFSGLTYANYLMRQEMLANSRINPDNLGKDSEGFFGDGTGLAGSRQEFFPGTDDYVSCVSLMGGCQGAPNLANGDDPARFGFINYGRGSPRDRVNEAFAGPHDCFRNLTGSYDQFGNARSFTGFRVTVDSIMNYALVIPAAPFAGAALASWPYSAFNVLNVKRNR